MSDSKNEPRAVARLISAEEREAAVSLLTAAFAQDAISVTEFESRVAEVYQALDANALEKLTADLPAPAETTAVVPASPSGGLPAARNQQLHSVMSSIERSIDGPMPERLDLRSIMGSMELDLRRAKFTSGVYEIRLRAIMGNIEIELPDNVQVEKHASAFLSSFSVKGRSRGRGVPDGPVVRITGHAVMASVEVEVDD